MYPIRGVFEIVGQSSALPIPATARGIVLERAAIAL